MDLTIFMAARHMVRVLIAESSDHLFELGDDADASKKNVLDWERRFEIVLGTAEGLSYLHNASEIRIIHRNIKAGNILLDERFRPKIADFGLARNFMEDQSHLRTGLAGTL